MCKKLVCEIRGNDVRIKCGRCKRIVVIATAGINEVRYEDDAAAIMEAR